MFRPLARSTRRPHRRGTSFVLIVVVMISFAAAVGVAFALFAGQALRMSQAHKAAQGGGGTPELRAPEPTNTVNKFFSALIYGVGNDSDEDVTNALRGNELSRSMYGGNIALLPTAANPGRLGITTPWNGVGTFRENIGFERAEAINFTQLPGGFLLDPEYTGNRRFGGNRPTLESDLGNGGRNYISKAAGYSYPDIKDFFAAAVDPATGRVVTPSFHRDWLFRHPSRPATESPLHPDNPNWNDTSAAARVKTLRPRRADHPRFPRVPANADGTFTGDVQNWPGGYYYNPVTKQYVAHNDSLWMHIGLPPVPFGNRKVQPLVAPLIVPLDGFLNAGAHGNNYGLDAATGNPKHLSYAGHDPSEINLSWGNNVDPPPLPASRQQIVNRHAQQQLYGLSGGQSDRVAYNSYGVYTLPAAPTTKIQKRIHDYAPVAWFGGQGAAVQYPTGADLSGLPSFGGTFFNNNGVASATGSAAVGHPTLHSAGQYSQYSQRQWPLSDLKKLSVRYAFNPDWYVNSQLGNVGSDDLGLGTNPGRFTYTTTRERRNEWRVDDTHPKRKLVTPAAFGLDRPKLAPNFAGGGTLRMTGLKPDAINPGGTFPTGGGGPYSDIPPPRPGTGTELVNRWAALGAVDINRALADYRTDPSQPLGIGNVQTSSSPTPPPGAPLAGDLANADRRKLAHDIFVRLAAATGARLALNVNANGEPVPAYYPYYQYAVQPLGGTGVPGPTPGTPEFNALRYLAQLAVNIVDFRDEDDISTAFVWNPLPKDANNIEDPHRDPRNFDPLEVGNRVVFGVEKSRAVLNEVYSEVTNDPTTPVSDDNTPRRPLTNGRAWVKFWAELVNPMTPSNSQIVPNATPLRGYRIEIARGTTAGGFSAAFDPNAFYDPSNVTGGFTPGVPADTTFDLSPPQNPGGATTITAPAGATYAPGPALPANGIVLVAPPAQNPPKMNADEFNPQGGLWAAGNVVRSGVLRAPGTPVGPGGVAAGGMGYELPMSLNGMGMAQPDFSSREFRRHVVLLRRKANPYVVDSVADPTVGQLNPHITVDVMDYVPSFDAVHRQEGQSQGRGRGRGMGNGMGNGQDGYDPPNERFSVGKVQPYAGFAALSNAQPMGGPQPPLSAQPGGPANFNTYTFPESMVLAQDPQPGAGGAVPNEPKHTLGRHNGRNATAVTGTGGPGTQTVNETPGVPKATLSDTVMAPFDWLVHMDRPLVNAVELFQMRDTPAHLVTQRFVRQSAGNAAPGVTYEAGYARWQFTNDGIGRALELLSVKPFTTSVAHGGRIAGQVNVNAIRDKRVFNGVFDPAPGNSFNDAFVDAAWGTWLGSRTAPDLAYLPDSAQTIRVSGATGKSVQDGPAIPNAAGTGNEPQDAPFQAGAAMVGSGLANTAGATEILTVLRNGGGTRPNLFNTLPRGQNYFEAEPLRKITNLTTTVSHSYVVFLTVGYFEIDFETAPGNGLLNLGPNATGGNTTMSRLGHEAYLNVPGDMRQKFVAVVDMSMMAMEPNQASAKAQPFFTTLEETARPGQTPAGAPDPTQQVTLKVAAASDGTAGVDADGRLVRIEAGQTLVLGYGAEQQLVTVVALAGGGGADPLSVTVTGLERTAWAGSSVSNARAGYAGPQATFRYDSPQFSPVIPYVGRLK